MESIAGDIAGATERESETDVGRASEPKRGPPRSSIREARDDDVLRARRRVRA